MNMSHFTCVTVVNSALKTLHTELIITVSVSFIVSLLLLSPASVVLSLRSWSS